MSETKYVVAYRTIESVERASKKTMASYIEDEKATWTPFLNFLAEQSAQFNLQIFQTSVEVGVLVKAFDRLEASISNPANFSRSNAGTRRDPCVTPPPSSSTEGRTVLGLYANGRTNDALAAYVRFIVLELSAAGSLSIGSENTKKLNQRGDALLTAGYVSAALPYQRPTTSQIRATKLQMEATLRELDIAVGEAEGTNADHKAGLTALRDGFLDYAIRLKGILLRSDKRRRERHRHWQTLIDTDVKRRIHDAEQRLEALDRLAAHHHKRREEEFEGLKDLFHVQLRLRAPVALWEGRAQNHRANAAAAVRNFWIAAVSAITVGIVVPIAFGDYIAGSFTRLVCTPGAAQACALKFSAKGPLTVAGVLLTTSLILWATRLQYRIFLSERHLALDADEKKAFAETFMALKEGASVDVSNETIVLASLFRPTQDGIIKDEDSGFDLSAVALLAKQMAR